MKSSLSLIRRRNKMHKVYLNKSELSLIKGSGAIVNKIGCFPSMENCEMDEIKIYHDKDGNCILDMVFDIEGWLETVKFYSFMTDILPFPERKIKLSFKNFLDTEHLCLGASWIWFDNDDPDDQTCFLGKTNDELKRPYTTFRINTGCQIAISEKYTEISAELF